LLGIVPGAVEDPFGIGILLGKLLRVERLYRIGSYFLSLPKYFLYKQSDKKLEQLLLTGCGDQ
jgi:hypothetical protein